MAYEVSYAGQLFLLDDPKLLEEIERRIPFSWLRDVLPVPQAPRRTLHATAFPLYPDPPPLKLGEFFYPTGATRWACFHGIMPTDRVRKVLDAARLVVEARPAPFVMRVDPSSGDAKAKVGISTQLHLLPPRQLLSTGRVTDPAHKGLWLVTLVDERFFWQQRSTGTACRFAMPTKSWEELIEATRDRLGLDAETFAYEMVDAVFGDPSEDSGLYNLYDNAARLLDVLAWNTGTTVVRNLDGTYKLQTVADAVAAANLNEPKNGNRLAGGDTLESPMDGEAFLCDRTITPALVETVFPKFVVGGTFVDDLRDSRDWYKASWGHVYSKQVTALAAGFANSYGQAGEIVFHDAARAYYAAADDADPQNKAELDALALRIAQDYYRHLVHGVDVVYPGIRAWEPEGLHDVLWTVRHDMASTRVQRKPWNYQVAEFQHEVRGESGPGTAPGGGGSITVKEVDGTPTIAGVTTIEVNANGAVSDQGSGVARLNAASASGGGVITASSQTIAGEKTFNNTVFLKNSSGLIFNFLVSAPVLVRQISGGLGTSTFTTRVQFLTDISGPVLAPIQVAAVGMGMTALQQTGAGVETIFLGPTTAWTTAVSFSYGYPAAYDNPLSPATFVKLEWAGFTVAAGPCGKGFMGMVVNMPVCSQMGNSLLTNDKLCGNATFLDWYRTFGGGVGSPALLRGDVCRLASASTPPDEEAVYFQIPFPAHGASCRIHVHNLSSLDYHLVPEVPTGTATITTDLVLPAGSHGTLLFEPVRHNAPTGDTFSFEWHLFEEHPHGSSSGGFADGSVDAPGIAFASDPDTGIYRPGDDTLAIACGGTNVVTFTSGSGTALFDTPIRMVHGNAIQANTSAGHELIFQARDVDGAFWRTFITLISNNTPLCNLSDDVTKEWEYIYRGGGTDVPVADGGTGRSSHTAYAVLCGGTTTTGAQQSVSGVGSAGQVLTSAGASALPTWSNPTGGAVDTVSGTAFRITVSGTSSDVVVDISTDYVGQTSITTLGTVTTGTWSATTIAVNRGGTGRTSHTEYAVICGGTSTTGAQQSVASVGTSGHPLVSAGAGALPAFGQVGSTGIADNAVTEGKLASNAVTYAKLQQASAGFTIMAKVATGAGNYAELAAGTDGVLRRDGSGNLAFGTIVAGNIASNAVSTAKILDANVTAAKLGPLNAFTNEAALAADDVVPFYDTSATANRDCTINDLARNTANANLLINGGFDFFQRQSPASATSRSNEDYGPDRWYVLTQTAAANVERVNGDAATYAVRVTQPQASAQRIGIASVLEFSDVKPYRGRTVRFQCKLRSNTTRTLRIAVLEWTGSTDNLGSAKDVVNSWTSGTFTLGNFFKSTSMALPSGSVQSASVNTSWTSISTTVTLGSSTNNLIVFIWSDSTVAQDGYLEVTEAGVYEGSAARDWCPRPSALELLLCQRYYFKTFPITTEPAQNAGTSGAWRFPQFVSGASSSIYPSVPLPVQTRAAGTVVTYNPSAANAEARNSTAGADYSSTVANANSRWFVGFSATGPSGGTQGQQSFLHLTVDAEL